MPRARRQANADSLARLNVLDNNRRNRRTASRQRAALVRMSRRNIACSSWPSMDSEHVTWQQRCTMLLAGLVVCAFCGCVGFGGVHDFEQKPRPVNMNNPPAIATSFHLHDRMVDADGRWWCCKHCANDATLSRCSLLPTHTSVYQRQILSIPSVWLQSLSLVDVCMDVNQKYHAFASGSVSRKSAIDAPITILSHVQPEQIQTVVDRVSDLLAFSIQHNPLYQSYLCMYEVPGKILSFPVVTSDALARFLSQIQQRSPLYTSSQDVEYPSSRLCILSDVEAYEKLPSASTFKVGHLHCRHMDQRIPFIIQSDSLPVLYNERGVTMEAAVFPYLFPHGQRFWTGQTKLGQYLKWRMSCMFTTFTLCTVYPLLMYQLRQLDTMTSSTRLVQLESEIFKYKQRHPNATEEDIYHHVLKYTLPDTMPGSPSWHRKHLQDLIHTVSERGMPSLFLTLTADEVSHTRWDEITLLEQLAKLVDNNVTYENCPIECAAMFHQRLWSFLRQYIILPKVNGQRGRGLLGRITNYLVRYEAQGRGSLHAHIILWVHPEDLPDISKEIIAYIPCTWSEAENRWYPLPSPKDTRLLDLVLKKQIHTCREGGCCKEGKCQYGFPFETSISQAPVYNQKTKRYDYCRLNHCDRNVVPYHPSVLLLWGAHMNIQVITNEAWSYYVLKYSLKSEPHGYINFNYNWKQALGIQVSDTVMKAFYAMHCARPISCSEVALYLLDISTLHRDCVVDFIPTAPPELRMKVVLRNTTSSFAHTCVYATSIDKYTARPDTCDNMTFYQYFSQCTLSKSKLTKYEFLGLDHLGNFVHKLPNEHERMVRFTDYHPGHNPEAFCYNLLLKHVPFRSETELISHENAS